MSLSHETMLELMQYADGELEGDARARIEALLRTSQEARGVVDAMGTLGEVVREGVEGRAAASTAADGIADGVMAAIARQVASGAGGPPVQRDGGVVRIEQARPARRARGGATPAIVAVLALAAGVLFFLTTKAPAPTARVEPPVPSGPATEAVPEPEAPSAAPETVAQTEAPGVDLEEVRSVRNKVNVFFMPPAQSAGAAASVVVWIDDRHGGH